jgi:hypothetical protein
MIGCKAFFSGLAFLHLAFVVTAQQIWTVGQGVETTSGRVVGMASTKAAGVSQYLGIPFAQAPVGPNRWLKPLNFTSTAEIETIKQAP